MIKEHKRRRLLLIPVIIILIAIIVALFNRETILPKYIEEETKVEENKSDIIYEAVAPMENIAFRIQLPTGMEKIKDGSNTYYLSDNLNVTMSLTDYTHTISEYSESTYLKTLSGEVTLMSFDYPSTSSRLVSYRRTTNGQDTVVVVFNVWDRKNIINVTYEISSAVYEEYLPVIKKSIDSYTWDTEYGISEYLCLKYSEYGKCDYAVPIGFKDMNATDMYMYTNDKGSIVATLEIYENSSYLDAINNIAYTEYASNGKKGFGLRSYDATKEKIVAESYYTDTNTGSIVNMYQMIVATGTKQYFVTYYVENDVLNDVVLQSVKDSFEYFRIR